MSLYDMRLKSIRFAIRKLIVSEPTIPGEFADARMCKCADVRAAIL